MLSTRFLQAVPLHVVSRSAKKDVKESVPSAMNVKAARMISKSNRLIKRSNDVRAAAEDGRTAKDGTGCGACQQVETAKKRNSKRKNQERQMAMTNKGGFGRYMTKYGAYR